MKQREFPAHYRQLAMPQLIRVADALGRQVGLDECDFATAHKAVSTRAYRLGAGYLPEHLQDELQDWICSRITKAAIASER